MQERLLVIVECQPEYPLELRRKSVEHLLRHPDNRPAERGPGFDGQADDIPGNRCGLRNVGRTDLAEMRGVGVDRDLL